MPDQYVSTPDGKSVAVTSPDGSSPSSIFSFVRDALQGVSNAAASTVSAPVDAISWGLRKAGLDVGSAPVGGSEWMANNQITAQPKNKVAGLIGDTIGGILPMAASAKAPQIANTIARAGENISAKNLLNTSAYKGQRGSINWPGSPDTLYHGSAKEFDRFDGNLLGKNTGANDASIGFHFADNPADADLYASMAAEKQGLSNGYIGKYDVNMQKPLVISPFVEDGNISEDMIDGFLNDKISAKNYAIDNNYDGVIYPHGTNVDSGYTAIAFNPDQIQKIK